MTRIAMAGGIGLLAALLLAFRLGLFAPGFSALRGTPIEETPLIDLAGHRHAFGELRGQPVTLYFWATWCGPCLRHLARMASSPPPATADRILPVALEEDPRTVAATLGRVGYHGPVWVATDGMALLQRRFAGNDRRAVPFAVTLDAAGRISQARYGD